MASQLHWVSFCKFSLVCNVLLGGVLIFLIQYSRGGSAESRSAGHRVLESAEAGAGELESVEQGEGRSDAEPAPADPSDFWIGVPLSGVPWKSCVFQRGSAQKLSELVIRAFEMTGEEVLAVEKLAEDIAVELKRLEQRYALPESDPIFEGLATVFDIPESELDALCRRYSVGVEAAMGRVRGRALADVTLLSRSFLVEAYGRSGSSPQVRRLREKYRERVRATQLATRPANTFSLEFLPAADGLRIDPYFTPTYITRWRSDQFHRVEPATIQALDE